MHMWSNEPRSLPDWIEEAYEILVSGAADHSGGFSHDRAYDLLVAHEAFPNEAADAEYAIERLLNSGWLYEVDGELRITDPEA
jgi:hypothetical protein